jgi:hypothetical protein
LATAQLATQLPIAAAGLLSAASNKVTAGALTAAKRPSRRSTARRSREDRFLVSSLFLLDILVPLIKVLAPLIKVTAGSRS